MRVLTGTSGFSYKEWVGPFYPDKLPAKAMLEHYATRLPLVEINNTFYRMPNAATIEAWRSQVPGSFRFAMKAPRRITHIKRLKGCAEDVAYFLETLRALGPCLGSVLFQLPPHFKRDLPRLTAFVAELPKGCRAAFEFRNDSWFEPEVFAALQARNLALVQSEEDDTPADRRLPWTASWAYLRLRKTTYAPRELEAWLERLAAAKLEEAQVLFKHEDQATGPKLAAEFLAMAQRA